METDSLRKKKTLILTQTNPNNDVMYKSWIDFGLNADIIFKNVSKPLRLIRRGVMNFLPSNLISIWLGNWKNRLDQYDTIILHASELTSRIPKYIHSVNPKIRIIYWYWNPVNKYTLPQRVTDDNVEFWTFDRKDQKKYNMKYNIQYYSGHVIPKSKPEVKYDIYFIGHDKGRKNYINKLKDKAESQKIKCKFIIIPDNSNKFIPYNIVRKDLLNSKAILEINQKGQNGYTLRALESLFLRKKLITNNKYLEKADFYCKDNIFILGKDNIDKLKDFINKPYSHKADRFQENYTISTWFKNFFRSK